MSDMLSAAEMDGDEASAKYRWDPQAATPSDAVVPAVADATDRAPEDLPALADAVDPAALNSFLQANSGTDYSLTFAYDGHAVRMYGDGWLVVRSLDDTDPSVGDGLQRVLAAADSAGVPVRGAYAVEVNGRHFEVHVTAVDRSHEE